MDNIFWSIIAALAISIDWVVLKIVLDEINQKKSKKSILYIQLIIAIFIIFYLSDIGITPNIRLLIGLVISFLFTMLNYDIGKLKAFLINLLYWLILIGIDAIGVSIITIINSLGEVNIILENNITRLELIIFAKSVLILIIPILKLYKLNLQIETREIVYITIPLLANMVSIVAIFGFIFRDNSIEFGESLIVLVISIILALSNISLILIIIRIIKDNKLRAENDIIKEKMNMQYNYYLSLRESQNKVKKLYHDINNHITCIKNISNGQKIVEEYVEEIDRELDDYKNVFNSGNMILDVILNEKKSICDKNNIEFITDVKFINCEFIDMIDVCSIFSNILDNAIEACLKIDDENIHRFIKIRTAIVKQFMVIKCKNSKINDVLFKDGKIITDKKDSFKHGLGLNSIKNSVEKYDGNVKVDIEEDYFSIIIYIPLRLK